MKKICLLFIVMFSFITQESFAEEASSDAKKTFEVPNQGVDYIIALLELLTENKDHLKAATILYDVEKEINIPSGDGDEKMKKRTIEVLIEGQDKSTIVRVEIGIIFIELFVQWQRDSSWVAIEGKYIKNDSIMTGSLTETKHLPNTFFSIYALEMDNLNYIVVTSLHETGLELYKEYQQVIEKRYSSEELNEKRLQIIKSFQTKKNK